MYPAGGEHPRQLCQVAERLLVSQSSKERSRALGGNGWMEFNANGSTTNFANLAKRRTKGAC
jgi:hypothetical protein